MSWKVFYDESTGEILRCIFGSTDTHTANTGTGEATIDPSGDGPEDGATRYVDDPGGTPVLADRPEMGATIPNSMNVSGTLDIENVPVGVDILVTVNSDGSTAHSGTKTGLPGTYDATPASVSDGDVLFIQLTGFPYQEMSGYALVQADP